MRVAVQVDIRVTLTVYFVEVVVGVSGRGPLSSPTLDFGVIVSTDLARRSVTVFNPLPLPLKMKAVVQPVSGNSGRFALDRAVDHVRQPQIVDLLPCICRSLWNVLIRVWLCMCGFSSFLYSVV